MIETTGDHDSSQARTTPHRFTTPQLQQIKHEITQQIAHTKEQMSHITQVAQRVTSVVFSTHEVCSLILHYTYIYISMVIFR